MVVSIGPFHRGKLHLKAMEQLKVRYLKQLVGELSVDRYVEAVRRKANAARACYAEDTELDDDGFVAMLLLDGVFIVEFLREYNRRYRERRAQDGSSPPFFGYGNVVCHIRRDLMLFENQIPLLVLRELFDLSKDSGDTKDLGDLIWPSLSKTPVTNSRGDDHLLGLVHRARCSSFVREPSNPSSDSKIENIRCATELKDAGIVFNNSSTEWLNITFKNKILDIHQLEISDSTESWFRNMIAYEFYLPSNSPKYVSDYAYFLQCLIHSSKDSELLRGCGVISNLLGGDARVYELIGRLGANVQTSEDFLYSGVFRSVNSHCRLRRNRWIAALRRKHFSNPWTSISLAAAAVLLSVGIVQMVYAVLSFCKFELFYLSCRSFETLQF